MIRIYDPSTYDRLGTRRTFIAEMNDTIRRSARHTQDMFFAPGAAALRWNPIAPSTVVVASGGGSLQVPTPLLCIGPYASLADAISYHSLGHVAPSSAPLLKAGHEPRRNNSSEYNTNRCSTRAAA